MAGIYRQENIKIKQMSGIAKVIGTLLCVGGALLLSFYHGDVIGLGQSSIHWKYAEKMGAYSSSATKTSAVGPIVLILSALIWAAWFIIQVIKLSSLLLILLLSALKLI